MDQEAAVQSVLLCAQCGRALPHSELVQIANYWVCADCKPVFLSRLMASGVAGARAQSYAGFWIRFAARFLDGLVLGVPVFVIALLFIPSLIRNSGTLGDPTAALGFTLTFLLGSLLIGACYEILMLKHRGATLGKMACGIKVVRADGSPLSWGVAIGRFFMWNVVSSGIPYINFVFMLVSSIMVGVDDESRAIHDRVCDTRVVFGKA